MGVTDGLGLYVQRTDVVGWYGSCLDSCNVREFFFDLTYT